MKTVELAVAKKEETGTIANKKLRRTDRIPAIVYGDDAPMQISMDYISFEKLINTPDTYIINLMLDGKAVPTIIREIQFHPVTDKILHVDFYQVNPKKAVEVRLPVSLVGTAKGVTNGGRLIQNMRYLKVKGIPANLPEEIEVDVTPLKLGTTIKVRELDMGDLRITSPGDASIAAVLIPRAVKTGEAGSLEDEEDEEGAEGEGGEEGGSEE